MPGYRRPQTTAFAPGHQKGSYAVEKAFQSEGWSGPRPGRLGKDKALDGKRNTVPTPYTNPPGADESSAGSQTFESEIAKQDIRLMTDAKKEESADRLGTPLYERRNGLALRRMSAKIVTPPHLTRENSGLPPTPPTMASSDDTEASAESLSSNVQFADAVRNALHTQKSGPSTPVMYLLTPDPSPPGTREKIGATSLHPTSLRHTGSSSRADSYHTAREAPTPSASQLQLPHTPSPEPPSPSPSQLQSSNLWLESPRGLTSSGGVGVGVTRGEVEETPASSYQRSRQDPASECSETTGRTLTPTPLHLRKQRPRPRSPYETVERAGDVDKHVSYISDHARAEHVNNAVYQHIQQENVKRHSAVSNDNAVPAGIGYLEQPVRAHRLRRTPKAHFSRQASGSDDNAQRASNSPRASSSPRASNSPRARIEGHPRVQLRHKNATIPSRSPETSPIVASNTSARRTMHSPTEDREYKEFKRNFRRVMSLEDLRNPFEPSDGEDDSSHDLQNRSGWYDGEDEHVVVSHRTLRHSPKSERLGTRASRDGRIVHSPSMIGGEMLAANSDSPPSKHDGRVLYSASMIGGEMLAANSDSPPSKHDGRILYSTSMQSSGSGRYSPLRRYSNRGSNKNHVPSASLAQCWQPQEAIDPSERTSRDSPVETKLENDHHVRHASHDTTNSFLPSSPRKSIDARFLHPTTTPMSTSQFSDRSEAEVCEAQGINIYPHNNHSLLLVQHGSRPVSEDTSILSPPDHLRLANMQLGSGQPQFKALVQEPSPTLVPATMHVDSPLSHPRTAPEPPAFMVIPPTPSEEHDRQLVVPDRLAAQDERPSPPQRRLSLKQRARRFSESFIEQPLFGRSLSLRKQPKRAADDNEVRPTHLSPLWRPNYIWDGYDSEDEYDDVELDGQPGSARLPHGGDTSEYEERESEQHKKRLSVFPRNMSVRMPGFRGNGGFLLGNSLGVDRHGTNNRRHYVVRKESMGGLGSRGGYVGELRRRSSEEMLKQMAGKKGVFTLPFSRGKKVQFVGVQRLRQRMGERKAEKQERAREKRRQALRAQIQHAK